MSYYYTNSLFNKELNASLFIRYYLGLHPIKDALLALNIVISFRVNSLLIS